MSGTPSRVHLKIALQSLALLLCKITLVSGYLNPNKHHILRSSISELPGGNLFNVFTPSILQNFLALQLLTQRFHSDELHYYTPFLVIKFSPSSMNQKTNIYNTQAQFYRIAIFSIFSYLIKSNFLGIIFIWVHILVHKIENVLKLILYSYLNSYKMICGIMGTHYKPCSSQQLTNSRYHSLLRSRLRTWLYMIIKH